MGERRGQPGRWAFLGRALQGRCPRCGSRGIFRRWLELRDRCPTCDYSFEREEGYWVGSMIVDLGVAQLAFFVFFAGGLLLTWPDVPWGWLLAGSLALMAILPIVFYPVAKVIWVGIDLILHPHADEPLPRRRVRRAE